MMKLESLKIIGEDGEEVGAPAVQGEAPVPALPVIEDEGTSRSAPEADLPKGAKIAENGGVELTLAWPVSIKFRRSDGSVREEKFERLTFRRLTGKDLRALMEGGEKDMSKIVLGRACGLGEGKAVLLWDAMDATDCAAAAEVMRFLSGSGRMTGR